MAFGIIAAGGYGTRLGAPKLDLTLLGKPMIEYSLEAFESTEPIESVVLVVPAEKVPEWSAGKLRDRGFTKVTRTVAGGKTRQASVWVALEEIPGDDGVVVVHDGARPLVTPALLLEVCSGLGGAEGVVACVPVTDTIKEVASGMVVRTLERKSLVLVQTPQAFRLSALRRAHREAMLEGVTATDDASLVEWQDGKVKAIEGSRANIKITYPEDVKRAESMLQAGGAP